jgi:hypothetical protein
LVVSVFAIAVDSEMAGVVERCDWWEHESQARQGWGMLWSPVLEFLGPSKLLVLKYVDMQVMISAFYH